MTPIGQGHQPGIREWHGSGLLLGRGYITHAPFPTGGTMKFSETGESVVFEIQEASPAATAEAAGNTQAQVNLAPTDSPPTQSRPSIELAISAPPIAESQWRQEIRLTVTAPKNRVLNLATVFLDYLADMVSFGSGRRVTRHLGLFTDALPGVEVTTEQNETIIPLIKARDLVGSTGVTWFFVGYVSSQIGDIDEDRGKYLIRSLRWLRRAVAADDDIGEFTALVFALNALVPLLPTPEGKRGGPKKAASVTANERMTHWAIHRAGVPEGAWRPAGDLRNKILHGGLSEDAQTAAAARAANPYVRLTVHSALKELLSLPEDAPPLLALAPSFHVESLSFGGPPRQSKSDTPTGS